MKKVSRLFAPFFALSMTFAGCAAGTSNVKPTEESGPAALPPKKIPIDRSTLTTPRSPNAVYSPDFGASDLKIGECVSLEEEKHVEQILLSFDRKEASVGFAVCDETGDVYEEFAYGTESGIILGASFRDNENTLCRFSEAAYRYIREVHLSQRELQSFPCKEDPDYKPKP